MTFRLLNVEILQVFRAAYCPSCFSCIFCIVAYLGNLPWLCDALQERSRFSSEAGTGHPATVPQLLLVFVGPGWPGHGEALLQRFLGYYFYRSPKRNCRGVSMGVDLGLAFCPGAMGLDTSGHRAPGRRIGLGSSPWFPGVSLPSCAKPNKLLNNHECWVLFLKSHESNLHFWFGDLTGIGPLRNLPSEALCSCTLITFTCYVITVCICIFMGQLLQHACCECYTGPRNFSFTFLSIIEYGIPEDTNKCLYHFTLPAPNMEYMESTMETLIFDILICRKWLCPIHKLVLWH